MIRLFFALMLASLTAMADVALMYSGFPKGKKEFAEEFKEVAATLDIRLDKYENIQIEELSKNLKKYDAVLFSSVANYENTVDPTPYAELWQEYLEQGGMLLIFDATYESILDQFLNCICPNLAMHTETCSSHNDPTVEKSQSVISDHPFLFFPSNIREPLQKLGHWGHLVPEKMNDWEIIESCVDHQALIAIRHFGNGVIGICAHGCLKSKVAKEFATNCVTNLLEYKKLRKENIEIVSVKLPKTTNDPVMSLVVKTDDKANKMNFSLVNTSTKEVCVAQKQIINDRVTFLVNVPYSGRGRNAFSGTLTYDDKKISVMNWSETLPEILSCKLSKKHFYKGNDTLSATIKATPDNADAGTIAVDIRLDGKFLKTIQINDSEVIADVSLTGQADGKHKIEFELIHEGKSLSIVSTEIYFHKDAKDYIRKDGTLMRNGRPFFPVGMYIVSWRLKNEERLDMLHEIARNGYNTLHMGIRPGEIADSDSYKSFLDECLKCGISVITEFKAGEELDVINTYKNHPAVLGWNPGDEPANKGITALEMSARYDSFKQEDPNHLIYTVICMPAQYKNYAAGTDVLAPDPYPVPEAPFENVYRNYKTAYHEAQKNDTALWAVPQCFAYVERKTGWTRPPTPDEYRGMLYLSLLAGVKGFISYTFYDSEFSLVKSPELWETCKTVPMGMQPLIPFILEGKRTICSENKGGIYAGTWTLNGRTAIVIVNGNTKKSLPFNVKGNFADAKLHYGMVENLKATSDGVSGTLPPVGSAVIFVK